MTGFVLAFGLALPSQRPSCSDGELNGLAGLGEANDRDQAETLRLADAELAVPVLDAKNRYQPTRTSSTNEERSPSFIPLNLTRYFPAAGMATAMS